MQKALLNALLTPQAKLAELQRERRFTELMALREQLKMAPIGPVWDEFCRREGVLQGLDWLEENQNYDRTVLRNREMEEN